MSENNDNRTATQRIEDLEQVVTTIYQGVTEIMNSLNSTGKRLSTLQEDMVLVKDVLKLLNKKSEAIIQAAKAETGITAASVTDLVVKMNVNDFKNQVAVYLQNNQIVAAETVTDQSFLVCEEINSKGEVVNPRLQFRIDTLEESVKNAFLGKKAGDLISFGGDKLDAKILEVYSLVTPPAPTSEAAPAPVQEATPEAAPAAAEQALAQESAPAAETAPAEAPAAPAADLYALPTENPTPVFVPSGEMLKADGTSTVQAQ